MNESLIKYLAGLLDADGSLSFVFRSDENSEGRYYIGLRLGLSSSDAVDVSGFTESLPAITGMGTVQRYGSSRQYKTWVVSKRADLEILLPRLIKHMLIKAKHWQWMLGVWREWRKHRSTCSEEERRKLSEMSKESRREAVGPLKPKNHPTWAWLAGYLDGDGTYTHRKNKANTGYWQWSMRVSAVAHVTDASVLEFLHSAFGGHVAKRRSENVYIWTRALGYQNRSFALSFLSKVAKHSRLKRAKIDAMIHHHRQRLSIPGTKKMFCTTQGCDSPAHGHGLCSKHYQRRMRNEVQATV